MNTLIKNLQELSKSMEQKRQVGKINIFGASLFFVAAFFAVSLLLAFLDAGGSHNLFFRIGDFLFNAYGYSSILIPVFFLIAALQMIVSKWNIKRGVILIGSLLPFFTLVAIEHLCKIFASKSDGAILAIEISSTILFGVIVFAGEYILLVILGDVFQERFARGDFDFENFDESDFDGASKKSNEKDEDDENAEENQNANANKYSDSPILGEMLSEATEIPKIQGETVLEFIKRQKPVDLESIFKNAKSRRHEEKDTASDSSENENDTAVANDVENDVANLSENQVVDENVEVNSESEILSQTQDDANPIENSIDEENGESNSESESEIHSDKMEENSLPENESSENAVSENENENTSENANAESGEKNTALNSVPESKNISSVIADIIEGNASETENSDEDDDDAGLEDDFWSSSADLAPFDKESAVKKLEEENRNKFAAIFDAVENNEEEKLADWRYAEVLKNILPDVLQEKNAEPVLENSGDAHEDFKKQIESLWAMKNAKNENPVSEEEPANNFANENPAEVAENDSEPMLNEEILSEDENSDEENDDENVSENFVDEDSGEEISEEESFAEDEIFDDEADESEIYDEKSENEDFPYDEKNDVDYIDEKIVDDETSDDVITDDEFSDEEIAAEEFANETAVSEEPPVVSASEVEISDIFSSMDDDVAKNPVLRNPLPEDVAKIIESSKSEPRQEIANSEPVLSEFSGEPKLSQAEPSFVMAEKRAEEREGAVEIEAAEEALRAAMKESYEPLKESVEEIEEKNHFEFNPVAKPVVDSNGKLIQYSDDDDESDLDEEISAYQNAILDNDADSDDDDEIDDEIDDLNRTINRKMNVSEDFDDEEDEEDESDESDVDCVHSQVAIDPYKSSTSNALPESQKFRKGPYIVPTDLLDTYPGNEYWVVDEETQKSGDALVETLKEFKIETEITGIRKGPTVTMYELLPAPGVKLSKIVNLQDNIALRLAASSVRIVAPIPGRHAVGIEVPNAKRAIVSFKEIIEQPLPAFEKMAIPVVLGKDISGDPQLLDLAKTPHLLIAGSTGAGKSVCVNSMLLSILFKRSPEQVKLVLVDPKVVELKLYNDIPHLLTPVITDAKRALQSLQYCLCEMERRYALLDGMGVRNIISYNKKIAEKHIATEKLPYIVVVIDEFADLMATTGKELETTIARLAAMSRAVGIHLVLATQRPSVDVITGLIKANIPSRIAFMVASKTDSRIIIDQLGADKLLGKGDMLYVGVTDPFPSRIQGTLVGDDEVERVVEYVKGFGEPEYIDEEMFVDDEEESDEPSVFDEGEDPLYEQALQIVVQAGKASASYIQRRLKIGYNRAARLVEEMENRGIVGPQNGSKPREIIHMP